MSFECVTIGPCQLYRGDAIELLSSGVFAGVDAVVTDPPWGMNANTDSRRFSGGAYDSRRYGVDNPRGIGRAWTPITGDDKPFDPSPWLNFGKVVLWGANHFGALLPVGTTLVWLKKNDNEFGTFLSDAEVAWCKGGCGVYCFRKLFPPPTRMAEAGGKCAHPMQKPVSLMSWAIAKAGVKNGERIADPYMGSGTGGVAAVEIGCDYIGSESVTEYFDIACRRIERAWQDKKSELPYDPPPVETQPELFP